MPPGHSWSGLLTGEGENGRGWFENELKLTGEIPVWSRFLKYEAGSSERELFQLVLWQAEFSYGLDQLEAPDKRSPLGRWFLS